MSTLPCVVGTWPFSQKPVSKAVQTLIDGYTALYAVEAGINLAEQDSFYGPYHVGCGGWQNAEGVLELDAAIMDGKHLDFGAVTALQGFSPAISVARRVLEKSRHNMLTGRGAAAFAEMEGFLPQENLGTASTKTLSDAKDDNENNSGHDTLGLLALDHNGNICAGVSTSGMSSKASGRVGDSALPGCGLYADSVAGGACCSGDGDEILKYCPSYKVVDLLKQGYSPQDACQKAICEICRRRRGLKPFEMVIIALDNKGNIGAANIGVHTWKDDITGKEFPGFPYVVMDSKMETALIRSEPPFTAIHL